ncbi:MAG: DoxX family protein [Proteobacteria bacterium]|nr:DoxX family protein [Pseudomonadota bacterium]
MLSKYNQEELGKLVLRLCVGVLMLFHGYSKIANPGSLDWIGATLSAFHLPSVLAYGVYVGEILAPLMIIIGFRARLGGWLIFVNMVFALFLAHQSELLSLSEQGAWAVELQGFYLFCGLAVALLGSGALAVRPD